MFDGLYQAETDQALTFEAESPRLTPKPETSWATGLGTAFVQGPAQGVLEVGRNVAGAVAAAGSVGRVIGRTGMDPARPASADVVEEVARDLNAEPESSAERWLGRKVRDLDPDPETSATAAQLVHQFGRLGVKIAGAAVTGGVAGVPLLVGGDEALTEAAKLRDKGVDRGTAAAAGAVHGLATGASIALPIAGKTIGQTLGLAAAGGPLSFMGEQSAIREILSNADYTAQAAEYDPFDVTGLVASTAGPLLFGAAVHGLRARRAAGNAPATAPVPDEVVDAARVALLDEHDLALVRGEGPEAVQAHTDGRAMAERRIQAGEAAVEVERGTEIESGPARAAEETGAAREPAEAEIAQPAAQDQAGSAESTVPPDVQRAREAITARGDFEIELEDGSRVSASQALADAEQLVADADLEAKAFRVAAECALEVGA
jgi:hypothetical protein